MTEAVREEALQVLRRCEVFLGLDDSDLERIASLPSCHIEIYEAGGTISKEGELARNLCVLEEGKVNLEMELPANSLHLARRVTIDTITRGGIFDWSALVPPHVLTRSAICAEGCKVLAINGAELLQLMNSNPHLGYEVMQGLVRVIASRLRYTQRLFAGGQRGDFL